MPRTARTTGVAGLPVRELQLATLVAQAPEGPEWLHEQKFDGYRILADKHGDDVRLLSRRFLDWTDKLRPLAEAVARLPVSRIVLDGEACVLLPDGRTSFQAMQNAMSGDTSQLVYFAFDLLVEGADVLVSSPLEERKERLRALVAPKRGGAGRIRYSDHVIGNGAAFFAAACAQGLEGIVSKRRDLPYSPGRGRGWLKTKCLLRQELVIGGFTDPEGSRTGIGALLLGYYAQGKLVYAGKVGTGFTTKLLAQLRQALAPLEQAACPFDPAPARAWTGRGAHWVAPELVAEVAFSEWTDDGRLRHPSFQGLRVDKRADEVVREVPSRTKR
jgi:bifunctional non-homologous end joining protein LigD